MSNIYFAAPLHDPVDQQRNRDCVCALRRYGHQVYLPQECGIWEQMVDEEIKRGIPLEAARESVRRKLFVADRDAVGRCDFVIAYFGNRAPSEGALWEMGYACGLGKPVYLVNLHDWKFNLMPEFGSTMFTSWEDLANWIEQESFK